MDTPITVPIIDYAMLYAVELGWAVFPLHSIQADGQCTCGTPACKSPGKHPRTSRGSLDASLDAKQITEWFADNTSNIGIATGKISNLVVVDIDRDKGAEINDLMIGDLDQLIFDTPKIKTGAGLHYYYNLPENVTIKNSASRLGKFIDVRGEGGYVVAPPSKHFSGTNYEMLNPENKDIALFPQAWIDKLTQPLANSNGNGTVPDDASPFIISPFSSGVILPDSIDQGKRNVEMTAIAGALRSKGLSEGAIYAALDIENQRICKPPLGLAELHQIAHSVSRYAPHNVLNPVADADPNAAPLENTLIPFYYRDFKNQKFEPKEILSLHIGKGDVAMLAGATNAGKSTLLRNILMCMAAGRPFMPFFDGARPIKTVYFDLETDAEDLHRDTSIMDQVFTPIELENLGKNLIVVPKGMLNGDLFQFNTHEDWINALIKQEKVEFVIVDNVSAAFDLRDENSGSEVTKKVMKPLGKLAMQGHCGVAFAHHFGKAKQDMTDTSVHASRGSSSFQNLSRTVFNMYGNVSKGEMATVECAKRKTDGGQSYQEVLRLETDRWFHHTTIVAAPRPKSCMEAIVDFLKAQGWKKTQSKSIIQALEPAFHRATIFRTLNDAKRIKMIESKDGKYWLAGSDDDEGD